MTPALLLMTCLSAQVTQIAIIPQTDSAQARALDAQLRAAADRVEGVSTLEIAKTVEELNSAKELGIACALEDTDCLGRLAAFFRVAMVIVPSSSDGKVRFEAFDPKTGGRVNVLEHELPPEGPERLARFQRSLELLLFPERQLGGLVVRTHETSTVSLDGAAEQPGPTARFDAVRAGPHTVRVVRGDQQVDKRVTVVAGELKTLDVILDERAPKAEASIWPGVAVAGTGTTLAIGGAIVAALAAAALDDATENPIRGQEARDGMLRVGQVGLATLAVGVVALGVGGFMTMSALGE